MVMVEGVGESMVTFIGGSRDLSPRPLKIVNHHQLDSSSISKGKQNHLYMPIYLIGIFYALLCWWYFHKNWLYNNYRRSTRQKYGQSFTTDIFLFEIQSYLSLDICFIYIYLKSMITNNKYLNWKCNPINTSMSVIDLKVWNEIFKTNVIFPVIFLSIAYIQCGIILIIAQCHEILFLSFQVYHITKFKIDPRNILQHCSFCENIRFRSIQSSLE